MIKEKIVGTFTSSDTKSEVKYYLYLPDGNPSAIVQISHGIGEYIERYENEGFVSALTDAGFVVCGNDHIGHGQTAKTEDELGHFEDYEDLISDLHTVNDIVKKRYPHLPYILLGHGMGSFLARSYVTKYDDVDGAVFSGTSAGNTQFAGKKFLSMFIAGVRGDKHRSKLLSKLFFGSLNKEFAEEEDRCSYISSDNNVRNRYRDDKLCTISLTALAYRELADLIMSVSDPEWVSNVPLSLPVLLMSGENDPLSEKGEGIKQIYSALEDRELNDLQIKLYRSRHDIFFDTCKNDAVSDLIEWIKGVSDGVVACRSYNAIPFGKVDF